MTISFENWKALMEEGNLAHSQRHYAAAEIAYEKALKEAESWPLQDTALEQDQLDMRLTKSLNNMAALYQSQGKYKFAEELYLRSLDIKKRLYTEEHYEVSVAMLNLGTLFCAKGDFEQAETFLERSLEIREKVLGPEHPDLAKALHKYALVLRKLQRLKDADSLEARAMKILAADPGST